MLATAAAATAQRRVNPVNNAATATQTVNENRDLLNDSLSRRNVVEMTAADGRTILVDTVAGTEWVDSLPATIKVPRMEQPLLYAMHFSADVATALMRAFGRDYGIAEIAACVNLHNRYLPVMEAGLGQATHAPEGNNYTYRAPLTPFFRIGIDYNFLYNSNPDYMFFAGVRYGLSPTRFSVDDITMPQGYWGETPGFSIPTQSSTIGYFQFLLGLRLRIAGNFSLGWTVRYQSLLHETELPMGNPWYIPGFGSRGSTLSFTFSATWTLRFKKQGTNSPPKPTVIE